MEQAEKKIEIVNYLENIPSKKELEQIIKLLNISPLELVRKNEAIWKEKFKGKSLSDDDIIEAMVKYPKLIERPIVINENQATIGRPPSRILEIL